MTNRHFTDSNNSRQSGGLIGDGGAESGLQDGVFAEEAFHGGLNDGLGLQPVRFEPADYDYNYEPQGQAAPEPEFSEEEEWDYPDGAAYEKQDFTAPNPAITAQNYEAADFAAAEAERAPARQPVRQNFGYGYSLQATAYNGAARPIYGNDFAQPRNEQSFAAEAAEFYDEGVEAAHNIGTADDFSQADFDYAGAAAEKAFYETPDALSLSLVEEESRQNNLDADLARLKADVETIDEEAGAFPLTGPEDIRLDEPAPAERDRPANAPFFTDEADPLSVASPARGQNASRAAAQDPAADPALGDGLYDWAAPVAAPADPQRQAQLPVKKGKGRKLALFAFTLLLLLLAGGAYYWFLGDRPAIYSREPVIIHKAEGPYKVKPDNAQAKIVTNQEQAVGEGVSSGSDMGQNRQEKLINKTEDPVEMQKIEDRLPFSDEGSLDQSAVDSWVQSAVARATPVHIIPSVRVGTDRKIIAASSRRKAEEILLPGGKSGSAAKRRPEKADNREASALPLSSASTATAPPVKTASSTAASAPKPDLARTEASQTAATGGSFYMQISSQPSKEAAEQSLRMAKKYLGEEAGSRLVIIPALIPNKGTYYRVRIPADSREAAARLCEDYKQAGGNCFVAR